MRAATIAAAIAGVTAGVTAGAIAVAIAAVPSGGDLTPGHVRTLMSAAGFNPGTIRRLEGLGLYQLESVSVAGAHGDFNVHLRVRRVGD